MQSQMQSQFGQMQDKLAEQLEKMEVTGQAGAGLVTITMNGANEVKAVKINPECVDPEDIEGLETLVKAAYNDANEKLKEATQSSAAGMSGMEDFSSLFQF